jgi:hypothetical protein
MRNLVAEGEIAPVIITRYKTGANLDGIDSDRSIRYNRLDMPSIRIRDTDDGDCEHAGGELRVGLNRQPLRALVPRFLRVTWILRRRCTSMPVAQQ